jgi:hypothetical protein
MDSGDLVAFLAEISQSTPIAILSSRRNVAAEPRSANFLLLLLTQHPSNGVRYAASLREGARRSVCYNLLA